MRKRLWRLFTFTCIKTPIAALLILTGLIAGMLTLMNSIRIQNYAKVQGEMEPAGRGTVITVQGKYDFSGIHKQDKITWYVDENEVRLEGTVINIDTLSAESSKLVIHAGNTNTSAAKKDPDTAASARSESPVYVELPLGKQTVFAMLFNKGAGQ
ncbi:hypothetical protein [Paenibacillus pedocola]|uniref:hypothetical protein n=1 Tax=Paenibacillus pedocola TaxID=3242193 RepID=UPI002877A5B9|nr:hypothetical protein [Paenibacillus typhae]